MIMGDLDSQDENMREPPRRWVFPLPPSIIAKRLSIPILPRPRIVMPAYAGYSNMRQISEWISATSG